MGMLYNSHMRITKDNFAVFLAPIVTCGVSHCVQKLFGHQPSDGIKWAMDNLRGIPLQRVCRGAEEANATLTM